jgi:hypothetical protein
MTGPGLKELKLYKPLTLALVSPQHRLLCHIQDKVQVTFHQKEMISFPQTS